MLYLISENVYKEFLFFTSSRGVSVESAYNELSLDVYHIITWY